MSVDLVVKNAKLVFPRGITEAGVAVKDGKIVAVARDIHLPAADKIIDAGGKYMLPGLLDGHAHTFLPPETTATGMRAAAKGGVTTMLEMPGTQFGCFTAEEFKLKRETMEKSSYVDFCIHAGCSSGHPGALTEMHRLGSTGAKFFISSAGPKWPQTFDGEVIERFKEIAGYGGLALIHAENDSILRDNQKRLKEEGRRDFAAHLEWRPRISEVEAGKRMIDYLEMTKCRGMIVHTSVPETVWYSAEARMRGAETYIETCTQYLYLTEDDVKKNGPWNKFAPPPRTKSDKAEIRRLLQQGWIDTIATDHAPYGKDRKEAGLVDIFEAPNGMPGLETYLPLLLNGVSEGWLSLERLSAVSAERPAQIYGVYPRKGVIAPGSDADMVIVDMGKEKKISNEDQITACGWTPYNGMKVKGWPTMSIIRGEVVMENDEVHAEMGSGLFIPRLDG
ncbi:amidohydrolase family protein [Candidatus Bathyarchaeota archaeon]|nr:amidohydrolase family protein [Candidatus Bathyarchaeota archaeon]